MGRILTACTSAIHHSDASDAVSQIVDRLWSVLSELSTELATYLGKALESANLTLDISTFLDSCFKLEKVSNATKEALSEFVYEAIETTCGIQTSVQGYLSTAFVLNSMNLASVVKNLSSGSNDAQAEQRFT